MSNRTARWLVPVTVVVCVAGALGLYWVTQTRVEEDRVKIGMSKEEVDAILGPHLAVNLPDPKEAPPRPQRYLWIKPQRYITIGFDGDGRVCEVRVRWINFM